jgi:hypothetical protein
MLDNFMNCPTGLRAEISALSPRQPALGPSADDCGRVQRYSAGGRGQSRVSCGGIFSIAQLHTKSCASSDQP